MSIETSLYAVLAAICPRVYPDVAPAGVARPYVTWQQVGGQAPTYVEVAVVDKRNADIQVSVWAETRIAANALALQIEVALTTAAAFQAKPLGALFARHDQDVNLYGTNQDFSLWAAR
jgi:hypothetical protein